LISVEPSQRLARQFGLSFRRAANQLQEQGQGPRSAFMLQCTILR
jgi:hypothetical protein